MPASTSRRVAALAASIAAGAGVVAAIGVFARGGGATAEVTSVRGEPYTMITGGVYAFNARRIVAEGVGWDLFTLFIVVPALVASLPAIARGSFRARLFLLGVLAYLFYQYLMYALTWAFGPLFLPFVALYAASLSGIVWVGSLVAQEPLSSRFSARFPRRGMALLAWLVAATLVGLWLTRVLRGLRDGSGSGLLLGQTTMVVQALDLGLVVPLALLTAATAWRGRPVGYVLCSVVAVKAVAMASAICAMLLVAWRVEGRLEAAPLVFFAATALAALILYARMLSATRA
jgi:hypothetical protein